jgi:hypothetical protein
LAERSQSRAGLTHAPAPLHRQCDQRTDMGHGPQVAAVAYHFGCAGARPRGSRLTDPFLIWSGLFGVDGAGHSPKVLANASIPHLDPMRIFRFKATTHASGRAPPPRHAPSRELAQPVATENGLIQEHPDRLQPANHEAGDAGLGARPKRAKAQGFFADAGPRRDVRGLPFFPYALHRG